MKRLVAACLLVLACLVAAPPRAADAVLRQLDARAQDATEERVLSGALDERFTSHVPSRSVFQANATPRWFRLDLPAAGEDGRRLLSLARMPLQDVRVYTSTASGGWREQRDSFFRPDSLRYAPHAFAFELPDEPARVYLRVENRGRVYLDASVQGAREFERTARRFVAFISIALTALAVMLTINFLFWRRLREPMYASYVVFTAALMAWTLFATGLVYAWLPRATDWLPGSLSGTLIALGNAAMLLFVRQYLGLSVAAPAADRVLRALMIAFTVLAAIYVLPRSGELFAVASASTVLFAVLPPVLLWVLIARSVSGSPAARLFLVAWAPLGVLSMTRTLAGLGWVAPSPLTLFGPLGAVAFTSVVLASALAGRALQFRLERDRALQLASLDTLTGALTRRAGEARLATMFQAQQGRAWPLAVIFCDMDLLKSINDEHGHQAGDACLRALAARIRPLMPPRSDLVRWGGDEFLLLLPGQSADDAEVLGHRILKAVRARAVEHQGVELALGVSLGIAGVGTSDASAQEVVRRADAALYDAKRRGRLRLARAV